MTQRLVLALSGWRGSGKDTVASHLCSEYNFKQLSFAAKLKDLVASVYHVPREDLDNPSRKEMPLESYPVIPSDPFTETVHHLLRNELQSGYWTPRALCILEGSVKRSVHSNYWIKSVIHEIVENPALNYVISDMRYQSEADTLKLFIPEIQMIRVERFDTIETTDPSERNLDTYEFDHIIQNKQDMATLRIRIDLLVDQLSSTFRRK